MVLFSSNLLAIEQTSDISQLKSAISLRQANQHHQAVDILEGLLENHSDHKRINIELAINYLKLADFDRSKEILYHLKTLELTENESKKIANLMKRLKNKQHKKVSPHQFSVDASLFYGIDRYSSQFPIYEYYEFLDEEQDYNYDDFSDEEQDYSYDDFSEGEQDYSYDGFSDEEQYYKYDEFSGELQEERIDESEHKKEHYFAQQLKGIYRYSPAKNISFFGQNPKLFFITMGTIYQRQINKSDHDNSSPKYQKIKINSVLSLLTKGKWLLSLKYRGVNHYQDNNRILTDHNIGLYSSIPLTYGRVTFGIDHKEKFYSDMFSQNDATVNTPSLEYSYRFNQALKIQLGSRYRIYQTSDEYNRYRSLTFYGSINYRFSNSLSTFLSYNYNDLAYTIDDPELVSWGGEVKGSLMTGLKYNLNKSLSFGINLHYIKNDFDRNAGENEWQRFETTVNYRF